MPSGWMTGLWPPPLQRSRSLLAAPPFQFRRSQGLAWRLAVALLACVWIVLAVAGAVTDVARPTAAGGLAAPPAFAPAGAPSPVDIEVMVGWRWFGAPVDALGVNDPPEPDVAVTALDVALRGIIAAANGGASRAILSIGGTQQSFGPGDALPLEGRVRLARTAVDHVLLDNNGQRETLWLYPAGGSPPRAAPPQPQVSAAELPPVPTTALTEALQLAEHRVGGELRGYRLQPGRDSERFTRLGLMPGDLLTAFDNVGLDQPEAALALFAALRDRRDLTLLIQRDSQELTLMLSGSAI